MMARSEGLSVSRLSDMTWSVEDRRAWREAYKHARSIDRRRRARERAASDRARRFEVCQDETCDGYGRELVDGLCVTVSRDYYGRTIHSVHVDTLVERGQ